MNHKVKILTILLISLALLLTACGSKTASDTAGKAQTTLDPEAELILGTLKLDGTDNAISIKQASSLVQLWKMYRSLATSDSAAPQEMEATIKQIKAAMTSAQLKAIADMDLNPEDIFSLMQEMGMAGPPGMGADGATLDFSQMQGFEGTPPAGGFAVDIRPGDAGGGVITGPGPGSGSGPGGGPRQGGGFVINGDFQGMEPGSGMVSGTTQAGQADGTVFRMRFNTRLVNALIDYLQKLVNEG